MNNIANSVHIIHNPGSKPLAATKIILDLDGCISNDCWRVPLIKWDEPNLTLRYHDYHANAWMDVPANEDLFQQNQHGIIIFTARPVAIMADTTAWLDWYEIEWETLMMRETDNHMPSIELKNDFLDQLLVETDCRIEDIVKAYDDRPDVVAMYKRRGIPAEVRACHDLRTW